MTLLTFDSPFVSPPYLPFLILFFPDFSIEGKGYATVFDESGERRRDNFAEAIHLLPDPRAAYLDHATGDDAALRQPLDAPRSNGRLNPLGQPVSSH